MWRTNPISCKRVRSLARSGREEKGRNHGFWDGVLVPTSTVHTGIVGNGSERNTRNTESSVRSVSRLEGVLTLIGMPSL